jgi:hypothetical protein
MRRLVPALAFPVLAVAPASAQRIQDFGFAAGFALHPKINPSPQLAATMTLGVRGHDVELAVGSTSEDAFLSASRLWEFSGFTYGAGVAVYNGTGRTKPGLAGGAAYALPIAPRASAALQVGARAIAVSGAFRLYLGAGIKLAPLRGGLLLGERIVQPQEQADLARSWDIIVAQIMLLDNGSSSLDDVQVSDSTIIIRFAAATRAELMDDVARVARILTASTDRIHLIVRAPEPVWIRAAITSGGFPAERITEGSASSVTTLQALRSPSGGASRSVQP